MLKEIHADVKNIGDSKLLAFFSALEEMDKDVVINMTESLVERHKKNEAKITGKLTTEALNDDQL